MNYDDIIDLPHYEPKNHPRMLPYKRAAQFMPFLPLNGYTDILEQKDGRTKKHYEMKYEEEPTLYW